MEAKYYFGKRTNCVFFDVFTNKKPIKGNGWKPLALKIGRSAKLFQKKAQFFEQPAFCAKKYADRSEICPHMGCVDFGKL